MKLPRDLSAEQLIQSLRKLGYEKVRQAGSHVRVRTLRDGEHHETIPWHRPLKAGTLNTILKGIAEHHRLGRDELIRILGL